MLRGERAWKKGKEHARRDNVDHCSLKMWSSLLSGAVSIPHGNHRCNPSSRLFKAFMGNRRIHLSKTYILISP